jgi:zinc/manganese transport system substrate-binding protein
MKPAIALVSIIALVVGLSAIGQQSARAQNKPRVLSSFSIIGEVVERVGGDRIEHRSLVGANTDSHTYEPTPRDTADLSNAELVVQNGLGFEPWLDRLYSASGSRAMRVSVAEGVPSLRVPDEDDDEASEGHEGHEHDAGDYDPHVWFDVNNMITIAQAVQEALESVDPAGAGTYQANAAQYVGELQALDAWVLQQVNTLEPERRKLVTSHDNFAYFANRYGFEIVGTALGSVSTEVADPSAGAVATLVNQIRAAGVPAIFAENVSNPRLMEQIAAAAGVELVPDLYTDALTERGTPAATYDGLMRHNVTRIVTALSR